MENPEHLKEALLADVAAAADLDALEQLRVSTLGRKGRITDLMRSGEAFEDLGVAPINPEHDRAMVCGNLAFNLEIKEMLEGYGLEEGANSDPKTYVVEKAFLD